MVTFADATLLLQMPHSVSVKLLEVSVQCGIFQGDTLSPLLFCIALNPLSTLLDSLPGYQVTCFTWTISNSLLRIMVNCMHALVHC